ncbi:MAG: hypothetical protein R8J94_02285 [Acidimicrobiia bacterium]|nr:hypothetical protein [Acidimicrobiia bacterium]
MLSTLAAIGFDPQIRGILVVGTGVVVLFGSIWLILATNSGIRLASLIALAGFFGWMFIMGGFWWIRGIGYVGDSVSWEVLDYNRANISQSSVEEARNLPDPKLLQGLGIEVAALGLENGVEEMGEFMVELDRSSEDFSGMTDAEFQDQQERNLLRNNSTTLSQVMSVAPDFVEQSVADGTIPDLNGWEIMNTGEAGEAQSTAGAAILERDGFDFDSQAEFRFLDAFRIGGKPRIGRDIDPDCTFCGDNLRRGWHWIANSARIFNPPEYSVVQLQAVDAQNLIVEEGKAPPFPAVDEDAPIISVVMIRDLGNLRFPPAMVTLGSLLIFTALAYMLHLRDLETMKRVEEFEAEA